MRVDTQQGFIQILAGIVVIIILGFLGTTAIKTQILTKQSNTIANQQQKNIKNIDEKEQNQNKNPNERIPIATTTTGSTCRLPKKDVPEHAFSIGIPKGWIYSEDNGTISITEDETNTTTVFLYTAKLKRNLTPRQFLNEFAMVFKNIIEGAGGKFNIDTPKETAKEAVANAYANVAEGALQGIFRVKQENTFITLSIYWAPKEQFVKKESLLKEIAGCFSRKIVLTDNDLVITKKEKNASSRRREPLVSYQGQYFKYAIPRGWKKPAGKEETEQSIELYGPDNEAAVSFAYLKGYFGTTSDIVKMVKQGLAQMGVMVGELQKGEGQNGQGFTEEIFTYRGTLQKHDVIGRIRVINAGLGDFMFYSQLIRANLLSEYAITVANIEDSIQITYLKQQNVLQAKNNPLDSSSIISSGTYRDQVTSRAANKWSDTMRGYEPVTSPTTGTNYDAPLNAWNPGGPEGPGYYHNLSSGGWEKLIQTNP